jgi:hypothetical protein
MVSYFQSCSDLLHSGYALGIWICGCSLFYKRELLASKSAGAHSTKSLKISGSKDLRVRAPAAPVLTHSLALLEKIVLVIEKTIKNFMNSKPTKVLRTDFVSCFLSLS